MGGIRWAGGCCVGARGASEAGDLPNQPAWSPTWHPQFSLALGQWESESRVTSESGGQSKAQAGQQLCRHHPRTTVALQACLCQLQGSGFAG